MFQVCFYIDLPFLSESRTCSPCIFYLRLRTLRPFHCLSNFGQDISPRTLEYIVCLSKGHQKLDPIHLYMGFVDVAETRKLTSSRLEEIIRSHSQILEGSFTNHSNSLPSDHDTPQSIPGFRSNDGHRNHIPQAETALFIQKPSSFTGSQSIDFGNPMPQTPSMTLHGDVFQQGMQQPNSVHNQAHQAQSGHAPEFYSTAQPPLASPSLNITQNQSEFASDHALPPYDLLYALVDLYFKHVNTWCPILHRRSTLDSLFGPSALDEADKILLHAIVATTLRYSTDQRLTEDRRLRYHDISKQKVLLYGLENSSVKALQALVILALDLVGSSNGPPGWNLLALITRSVVQLGLAVETTSVSVSPNYPSIYTLRAMVLPEADNFIEEESRRRLFWMVYLLDRYATIATAFEFALDEKEIDRTLPCRDDLWNKNQPYVLGVTIISTSDCLTLFHDISRGLS